ncbi:PiggyBac transposable element-derived protein 4 [Trichinella zimbabwensis]|uniref:PiggyBac transposable element-derived protein 4 n=1 Tax=Trichinella zimbabwensis TaxID=268475 RepID=A0A0V1HPF8_9BILA|nr:PiggyBac transposable element-derived protein 4 [Trichinella zimbabwensis]
MRAVLHLTAGLKGNNVTCDNFFTSHELAMQLLKKKLTILGTIKKNKPELPQEVLESRGRAVHSLKFVFTEQCTVVSYIPKKHRMVLVRSTLQKDASLSTGEGCKPEMILDYNATKGGVDNMDKMLAPYTCQRMTARWPLVIFYSIIDVSANNGYLLWTHCNPDKTYRRRLYLEELGKALVAPQILRRKWLPQALMSAHLVQKVQSEEQGTSKSTVQAASNKKRSRCQLCNATDRQPAVALCKESYDTGQFDSKRDQFLNMTEGRTWLSAHWISAQDFGQTILNFCCATTADLFIDTCHNSCCFFSMPVRHTVLRKLPVEPSKLTSDGVLDLFLSVAQKRLDL